jgi:outer membrane lipoprotein-sorting protein
LKTTALPTTHTQRGRGRSRRRSRPETAKRKRSTRRKRKKKTRRRTRRETRSTKRRKTTRTRSTRRRRRRSTRKRKRRTMRRRTDRLPAWNAMAIIAISCLLLAMPPAAGAQASTPDDSVANGREITIARNLIERLIERYESERSYSIDFRQESYWALADTSMLSEGTLLLERPAKLSVRYDDGSTIVSNGDTLWVYMAQTNQYFTTDIGADDTVIDPPRVLRQYVPDPDAPYAGPDHIADSSGAVPTASAVTEAALFLIPADSAGEPSRLQVTLDPSRSLVTGMTAHTRSGDYTRYEITDTRFGVDTRHSDFVFEVPPGAERVGG